MKRCARAQRMRGSRSPCRAAAPRRTGIRAVPARVRLPPPGRSPPPSPTRFAPAGAHRAATARGALVPGPQQRAAAGGSPEKGAPDRGYRGRVPSRFSRVTMRGDCCGTRAGSGMPTRRHPSCSQLQRISRAASPAIPACMRFSSRSRRELGVSSCPRNSGGGSGASSASAPPMPIAKHGPPGDRFPWSGRADSNRRPSAPKLEGLADQEGSGDP